jgi:hypothetical protein
MFLDARGLNNFAPAIADPSSSLRKGLAAIPDARSSYFGKYPGLATILEDAPGEPRGNMFTGNVVVEGRPFELTRASAPFAKMDDNVQRTFAGSEGEAIEGAIRDLEGGLPSDIAADLLQGLTAARNLTLRRQSSECAVPWCDGNSQAPAAPPPR